ncbi:MAG: ShlB/FhaC/HecB family hemolysin secretion/activation protein, partial [Deferribacterales bacterium]|nr:ShlB/FhaC/HecB family hemolysin secretion/activation protein [Deferribacterales bacterium]
ENLSEDVNTVKVYVKSFEFVGNRIFDKYKLYSVIKDFTDRSLTFNELEKVAAIVTDFYRKQGYIISYAYIPPQVIENDTVIIAVAEGFIGDVIVEGNSKYSEEFIEKHIEPLKTGLILNISSLERVLLILNSYNGLTVRASLKPGIKSGSSDIVLHLQESKTYNVFVALDNYGNKETSRYRLNTSGSIGNLFLSGDRFSAYFSMGLDNFKPQNLLFGMADYSIIYGGQGLRLGIAYARSQYKASDNFEILDLNGYSDEYSVYSEYPLILKSKFTARLLGNFKIKNSKDKLLGKRNTADGVYTVSGAVAGSFFPWQGGAGYYLLSFTQGLNPVFNGSHNSKGSSRPDAGGFFEKFYLEGAFYQNIFSTLRLNFYVSGQYASEEMFASEKFYIGGVYSVRGYENGVNSGDHGLRISAELESEIYIPQISALVFYDKGWVKNRSIKYAGYKDASLDSVGVGIRIYPFKGFTVKLDYGVPVSASREKTDSGTFYGRISYDF